MTQPVSSPRVLVTVCTYKERENLERLIPRLHEVAPQANVLVMDDNSPDGTAELIAGFQKEADWLELTTRTNERGLGSATIAAFRWGIEQGYEIILNLDADFSHPPEKIPELIAGLENAEVCIGSRYVPGGAIHGWNAKRHLMSKLINWWTRLWLGIRVRDCSGAFRCYRTELLKQLDWEGIVSKGYSFQEELLYRCIRAKGRVLEVPIVFEDREVGESKINMSEAVKAVKIIAWLGMKRLFGG